MDSGAPTALTAERLTHRFGSRLALDQVSFEVRRGELIAVIGPNGAGKTTLLSVLAGVLTPSEGTVRLGDCSASPSGPASAAGASVAAQAAGGRASGGGAAAGTARNRRRVGWVPQEPALYSKLSVAENLTLFARLERVGDPAATVAEMLEQTGLRDRAHDQVRELSGGNQQRVNIAIGLLSEPDVLLLDEPSASLDPRQRARLWEFISALAQRGTSLVYSTHDLQEARQHADRVLVLDEGRVRFIGPPNEMDWSY